MGDVIEALERHVRFAAARHGVLASNLANVDTPGYRARDLRFDEALEAGVLELRATAPGHLAAAPGGEPFLPAPAGGAPWGDRNDVELDVETAKMTENALHFQAAVSMMATAIRMYKLALRRS